MNNADVNISIKFISKLEDNLGGNAVFRNLPTDLRDFLQKPDGLMVGIMENLYPDQLYEIEIKIKTLPIGVK